MIKSVFKLLSANVIGRVSATACRLVQVPLLIGNLGTEEYGHWLLLSSLPAWVAIANLGIGSAASNQMSLSYAAGDKKRANAVYSSGLAFIAIVSIVGCTIIVPTLFLVPLSTLLGVSSDRSIELKATCIWMALSVFLSFFGELIGGCFRATGKAHVGVSIISTRPWIEVLAFYCSFWCSKRLDVLAASYGLSVATYVLMLWGTKLYISPDFGFRMRDVSSRLMRGFILKGLAFQAFPLGNALQFQGTLFVIHAVIGPSAVALFGTARTLSRVGSQMMEAIYHSVWPELTLRIGSCDFTAAARLHRLVVVSGFLGSIVILVLTIAFGPTAYALWTVNALSIDRGLLVVFMISVPISSLWLTSSVVHVASNQHEGLAVRYLLANVLLIPVLALAAYFAGMPGAAASICFVDIVMIPYVIRRSLTITHDTAEGFARNTRQDLLYAMRRLSKTPVVR